jgi:hypothetical protein
MDRNWNRGGNGNGNGNNGATSGEKIYRQSYSIGQHNHYRKKNEFSGQEYYGKTVIKPVSVQPIAKKESLQVALVENELMDSNFSWIKQAGNQIY